MPAGELPRDDGYRGFWYFNQEVKNNPYVYKYSVGFATYPQQQSPIAIYSERARETFVCHGGIIIILMVGIGVVLELLYG